MYLYSRFAANCSAIRASIAPSVQGRSEHERKSGVVGRFFKPASQARYLGPLSAMLQQSTITRKRRQGPGRFEENKPRQLSGLYRLAMATLYQFDLDLS